MPKQNAKGDQRGLFYHIPSNLVSIPGVLPGIRLFRNTADDLYYIKKSDGTIELFGNGGGASGFNPYAIATIDITGLDDIDMTGNTLNGIINLTSTNPTETINTISNAATLFPYIFRPEPGLLITWNDVLTNPLANLKLQGPALTTDGTNFGYLELQRRTIAGNFYGREYVDQYNN